MKPFYVPTKGLKSEQIAKLISAVRDGSPGSWRSYRILEYMEILWGAFSNDYLGFSERGATLSNSKDDFAYDAAIMTYEQAMSYVQSHYQPVKQSEMDSDKAELAEPEYDTYGIGKPSSKQKGEYVPDEIKPELKKMKLRDW